MGRRSLSFSGLFIALLGFFLTRFTVTLAATDTGVQFLFAGIVPLVLGLSLAAFGVVLTVGEYDTAFVRTTALWSLLGTLTMLLFIVLTLLGSEPEAFTSLDALRSQTILSNFLIGGAVGGTMTGLYAAQNRRHRSELGRQANRLVLLNRLLRDQVINAATAIKGHKQVLEGTYDQRSVDIIGKQTDKVVDIVENIKYLTNTADRSAVTLGFLDIEDCIESAIADVRSEFPDATYEFDGTDKTVEVRANDQIQEALRHLVENAIEHNDSDRPRVEIGVETTRRTALIRISDNGTGLPRDQQTLLEYGEIAEFDDPSTGFGLNIVRLLVESFDGDIRTDVTPAGTRIEVELPRTSMGRSARAATAITAPGVPPSRLVLAIGAGLVAGVTMGLTMESLEGLVPVIGALYGISDPFVGWITHEFHSVVFGLVYAGIISVVPLSYVEGTGRHVALAVVLGLVLWVFATGVIMPIWLVLVGVETPIPNLTLTSLAGHVVWGVTMGTLYRLGDRWLERAGTFEGTPVSGA